MQRFLRSLGVPPLDYVGLAARLPRYVRASPRGPALTVGELREAFGRGVRVEEAPVRGFFAVWPGSTPLAPLPLFRRGRVYGIDLASGVAVHALGAAPAHSVLDLCCAPGAKLCMLADLAPASLTGVDVSAERLRSTRGMLRRHGHGVGAGVTALVHADGRSYGDRDAYDRVLVDAECTHDGSVRHMARVMGAGWERMGGADRVAGLPALQRALLLNGFRVLRPGGALVYSTCSLSRRQNEDVVRWLLDTEPAAVLAPLGLSDDTGARVPCAPGAGMPLAARYGPAVSGTGGLFVARIEKRS